MIKRQAQSIFLFLAVAFASLQLTSVSASAGSTGPGRFCPFPQYTINAIITSATPTGNPLQSDTISGHIVTCDYGPVATFIFSWDLELVDLLNSANNFELTPANSGVAVIGAVEATRNGLTFDFSQPGEFLITANNNGYHYFCLSASENCLDGETISPGYIYADGVNTAPSTSGITKVAELSAELSAPEPSSAGLFLSVVILCAAIRSRLAVASRFCHSDSR
jgi:hypothetical protein